MKVIKKIKNSELHINSVTSEIENMLFTLTKNSYPEKWNTEFCTELLLKNLHNILHNKKIEVPGDTLHISCQPYKLKGESEKYLGDLAFIVTNSYYDQDIIEGVSYYSIACKDQNKNSFSKIRKDHLKRLNSSAHHALLLLFDYDNITGLAFPASPEAIIGHQPYNWKQWAPFTNCAVVQNCTAIELNEKNSSLYKFGIPFSYQICHRYLFGLDLDYSNIAIESAKGQRSDKGNPTYLCLLSISHGKNEHLDFDIHSDLYRQLL